MFSIEVQNSTVDSKSRSKVVRIWKMKNALDSIALQSKSGLKLAFQTKMPTSFKVLKSDWVTPTNWTFRSFRRNLSAVNWIPKESKCTSTCALLYQPVTDLVKSYLSIWNQRIQQFHLVRSFKAWNSNHRIVKESSSSEEESALRPVNRNQHLSPF